LRRIIKTAPLVLVFLLLNARSARSATCSFNPTPDPTVDGSPTSLRHAIQMVNASGQDCLITLKAGTYTLTIKNTNGHEDAAAQGDLNITDSGHTVTIQGQGAASSIVNGNKIDRGFDVVDGAKAVFSNLTIKGGIAQDDGTPGALPGTTAALGGGILVQGTGQASLEGVTLKGNQANGGTSFGLGQPVSGGGLYAASGSVVFSSATISGNAAIGGNGASVGASGGTGAGGGVYVLSGGVNLSASTVSENSAIGGAGSSHPRPTGFACGGAGGNGGDGEGGGMFFSGGSLTLSASTVSGNSVTGANAGGGWIGGPHCPTPPISHAGSSYGAGLFVSGGSISLTNSTFFDNTANPGGTSGMGSTQLRGPGSSAGGGLFIAGGSVNLVGVTIASNQVSFSGQVPGPGAFGGGISNSGATSLVSESTLIGDNIVALAPPSQFPRMSQALSLPFIP